MTFLLTNDQIYPVNWSCFYQIQNIKPIIVTTLYRPPGKPVEVFGFIDNLFHKLDDESKEYITVGDMNCDLLKPSKQCAKHIKREFMISIMIIIIIIKGNKRTCSNN